MTWIKSLPERCSEFRKTWAWVMRQNVGMTVLLAALLFLALPLLLILQISADRQNASANAANQAQTLAQRAPALLGTLTALLGVTLLLLFSVILCVRLFGYVQDRRSVDLFHALPVGRVPMLLARWCAGMAALAVPVLVNFAALWLILRTAGLPEKVGSAGLAEAMLWLLLMTAGAFTFSVAAMVCSGSVMDMILALVGVNIGFPLTVVLCLDLIQSVLPGTGFDLINLAPETALAPFPAAYLPITQGPGALPGWFLPWWVCLTAAMLAGACFLYRGRKSEAAGDTAFYPVGKGIVRFLVTACAGLAFGSLMQTTQQSGFLVGVFAGSAAAHVVMEALYARGFSTLKKSLPWYAAFAACFLVFYGVLATGCFGYDTRVPQASDVSSVAVGESFNDVSLGGRPASLKPVLKEPDSIAAVLKAHGSLSSWYRNNAYPYSVQTRWGESFQIEYRLKNGGTLRRAYTSAQASAARLKEEQAAVASLKEYRQKSDLAFYLQPGDMETLSLSEVSEVSGEPEDLTPDSGQKEALLQAIRQELLSDETGSRTPRNDANRFITVTWRSGIVPSEALREALGGGSGLLTAGTSDYAYCSGGEIDAVVGRIQSQRSARQ